jgi:hypothetical protein
LFLEGSGEIGTVSFPSTVHIDGVCGRRWVVRCDEGPDGVR